VLNSAETSGFIMLNGRSVFVLIAVARLLHQRSSNKAINSDPFKRGLVCGSLTLTLPQTKPRLNGRIIAALGENRNKKKRMK